MRVNKHKPKVFSLFSTGGLEPLPFLDNDPALRESKAECRAKNLVCSNLVRSNWSNR